MFLTGAKAALSKAWELIKKLPKWILIAVLFLGAIIWYLLDKLSESKKIAAIQKEISETEKDRAVSITRANTINAEEEKNIRDEHEKKLSLLKEEEKTLLEAGKKGPVAVANEWSNFLLKKGK